MGSEIGLEWFQVDPYGKSRLTKKPTMKRTILIIAMVFVLSQSQSAFAAMIPVYQVNGNDATWTETANQGEYTVPTSAEDYGSSE